MKALVTGGTGFIGSHLVEKLRSEGYEIRCIAKDALNSAVFESDGVEVVVGDLNNGMDWEAVLKDIDVVFHLAGLTRARVMKDYYVANCEATQRLLEACATYLPHLERFVYVSSLTAVGPRRTGEEVTESTRCRPISYYGKSKMLAEEEVWKYSSILPVTIVRPSAVYGPRDRDLYQYFKLVRFGVEPILGFGQKYMNIVHVSDLVHGIFLAGTHPAAVNETFFLGSEQEYTTRDICGEIARSENAHPKKVVIPTPLLYLIGALAGAWGKLTRSKTLFNIQKAREASQQAWTCSVQKAVSTLGYRQTIPLQDGIQNTYQWYLVNGWL